MIDNYNDLRLDTWLEIDAVLQGDGEDIDKQVQIIAILSGKSVENILALPLAEYGQMAAKTAFLRAYPDAVTAPARVILGDRVDIPTKDFTKISTAQYVDFQTFVKGGAQAFPQLLGVLLVPEGAKGYNDGYDVAAVVEDIKTLPVTVAVALVGFFFDSLRQSIEASLTSLTALLKKVPRRKKAELQAKIEEARLLISGAGLEI